MGQPLQIVSDNISDSFNTLSMNWNERELFEDEDFIEYYVGISPHNIISCFYKMAASVSVDGDTTGSDAGKGGVLIQQPDLVSVRAATVLSEASPPLRGNLKRRGCGC